MKPKEYMALIADDEGFIPTPRLRRIIRQNLRNTAREEAIAAKVIEDANPRECITGRHPWGEEEQFILQQLWICPTKLLVWRDVPTLDSHLYSTQDTKYGPLPIPESIKQPETVPMDLQAKVREALGEDCE